MPGKSHGQRSLAANSICCFKQSDPTEGLSNSNSVDVIYLNSINSYLVNRINTACVKIWAPQVALVAKNPPANAGDIRDMGSIPGLGRFP